MAPQGVPPQAVGADEGDKRPGSRKRPRQSQVKPGVMNQGAPPVHPKAVSHLYNPTNHHPIYNPAGPRPPGAPPTPQRPIMIRAHAMPGGQIRHDMIPVINQNMIHNPHVQMNPPPPQHPPTQAQQPMMIQQPTQQPQQQQQQPIVQVKQLEPQKMESDDISDLIPQCPSPSSSDQSAGNEEAKKRDILNFLMDIPQAPSPAKDTTQNNNVALKSSVSSSSGTTPPTQDSDSPIFKVPALPPKKKVWNHVREKSYKSNHCFKKFYFFSGFNVSLTA